MKNLMICTLFLLAATFAFAQNTKSDPAAKIQKKVDRMTAQLDLSDEQQAQVKDLLTEQQEARMAMKKNKAEMTEEEKAAFKSERKAARKDFNTKLNNILTPEQQEIYKSNKKKGKNKAKAKGKGKAHKKGQNKSPERKAERKVAKLTETLNLSDAQQEQMMDLMLDRAASKKNASEAKKEATSKEDHEAIKAQRKEEKANYQSKFEAILTAEQLKIYNEKKEDRKGKKKMKRKK